MIVSIELAQGVILVETSATIMLNVYFPIVKMCFQDDKNGSLFLCGDAKESEKKKNDFLPADKNKKLSSFLP